MRIHGSKASRPLARTLGQFALALSVCAGFLGPALADQAAAPAVPVSDADRERFLREAEVVRTKGAPNGITGTTRATLRLDGVEHDASIQTIDQVKTANALASGTEIDFRDSYKNNVAAYKLDRMMGLGMIPVTVVRVYEAKKASYTWWIDNVIMDEKGRRDKKAAVPDVEAWNREMLVVRVFDQLIYNFDRNLTNLLIDKDWRIWMIDHSRAFKIFGDLKTPKDLSTRCSRDVLAALRRLDEARVREEMKDLLTTDQVHGLLKRRDLIVTYYEKAIAANGEASALYDRPVRVSGEPAAARPSPQ
jgi:hypothetical protein